MLLLACSLSSGHHVLGPRLSFNKSVQTESCRLHLLQLTNTLEINGW